MGKLLIVAARTAGAFGATVAAVAAAARFTGHFIVFGSDVHTLLDGSVAAMVLATLCYVAALAEQTR